MKSDSKCLQFSNQREDSNINDAIFPKPKSCNYDPMSSVSRDITWRVKKISNFLALKTYRFLLTEMLTEERKFNTSELFVMMELTGRLEDERCRSFLRKYGTLTNACIELFDSYLKRERNNQVNSLRPILITLQFAHSVKPLLHLNAYYGMKKSFKPLGSLIRDNRALKVRSYDQRYIGVGYKDKGNKKVAHNDGSPAWQEVAASQESANLEASRTVDANKFYIRRRLFK